MDLNLLLRVKKNCYESVTTRQHNVSFMGRTRGDRISSATHGPRRRQAHRPHRQSRQHRVDAQEELPPVRSAPQAHRELARAAQALRDEEVSGDSRASRRPRGCSEEVLYFG